MFLYLKNGRSRGNVSSQPLELTLDSLINVPGTFINFWKIFQGVCSYLRGYVYWIWRFLDTKLEFSPKNPLYYNILLILSMGILLYQGGTFIVLKKVQGVLLFQGVRLLGSLEYAVEASRQGKLITGWDKRGKRNSLRSHKLPL